MKYIYCNATVLQNVRFIWVVIFGFKTEEFKFHHMASLLIFLIPSLSLSLSFISCHSNTHKKKIIEKSARILYPCITKKKTESIRIVQYNDENRT